VSFEQSFERGEVLSISHFLRQVVPEDCGFYGEQPVAVSGCATGFENFSHIWPALGPNPLTHSIGSKFCWKLGQNPLLYSPWLTC